MNIFHANNVIDRNLVGASKETVRSSFQRAIQFHFCLLSTRVYFIIPLLFSI